MQRDWQQTLAAAREGDETAWATIYREHAPGMLGYARARGAADPDEVVAQAFEQAAHHLEKFDGGQPELRAWLYRITHNRMIDEFRRGRRRGEAEERAASEGSAASDTVADAEREGIARVAGAEVRELIAVLSEDQQVVILLRIMGGLSVAETARILDKRKGAIRALQHRAVAALEREVARRGPEYERWLRERP